MSNGREKEHSICVSCSNEYQGMYCNQCGERVLLPREKTLIHYFHQLLSAFTFADIKLWVSLKTIVFNPGTYASDISFGRRVRYMRPLNLFLLCNLVYFLFPVLDIFNTSLTTQMDGLPSSDLFKVEERVLERVEELQLDFESFQDLYREKSSSNAKILLLILVLFFSVGFYLMSGRRKSYYVDHLHFAFEYGIFILAINTILLGYLIWFIVVSFEVAGLQANIMSDSNLSVIVSITSLYFLIRSSHQFYRFSWPVAVLFSLLTFGWSFGCLQFYRWILFEVTFFGL